MVLLGEKKVSSDNYTYVCKDGDQYKVEMRFASYEDYPEEADATLRAHSRHERLSDAMESAEREASGVDDDFGMGTEYGVSYSTAVQHELVDFSYAGMLREKGL
jgi:hypothetical protein